MTATATSKFAAVEERGFELVGVHRLGYVMFRHPNARSLFALDPSGPEWSYGKKASVKLHHANSEMEKFMEWLFDKFTDGQPEDARTVVDFDIKKVVEDYIAETGSTAKANSLMTSIPGKLKEVPPRIRRADAGKGNTKVTRVAFLGPLYDVDTSPEALEALLGESSESESEPVEGSRDGAPTGDQIGSGVADPEPVHDPDEDLDDEDEADLRLAEAIAEGPELMEQSPEEIAAAITTLRRTLTSGAQKKADEAMRRADAAERRAADAQKTADEALEFASQIMESMTELGKNIDHFLEMANGKYKSIVVNVHKN